MTTVRLLVAGAIGLAATCTATAQAQDDIVTLASDIPATYATLPVDSDAPAVTYDGGEVETITRTRWIERSAQSAENPHHAYQAAHSYPVRFDRESWLEECYARSDLGGSKKKRRAARSYCDTALDRYMRSASYPVPHVAMRSIPADYAYGYAPMYADGCGCSGPVTMIEVPEEIPQHVIVRENVREEWVDEPVVRERVIEEVPAPTKIQPIKSPQ